MKDLTFPDNNKILADRIAIYSEIAGPRVGDYLDFPDGSVRRVAHDWGDGVQPTMYNGDTGSFYFGNGHVSYSGSLEPLISIDRLEVTEEIREGNVWIFDRDWPRAGGGVSFKAPFRVYCVKG